MPKSRALSRSKAVYTPPPRSAKAQVSPRWLVPTMLGCLLAGLAWISLFYVTSGNNPAQSAIGSWNLVLGFAFIIAGVALATKWPETRSEARTLRTTASRTRCAGSWAALVTRARQPPAGDP